MAIAYATPMGGALDRNPSRLGRPTRPTTVSANGSVPARACREHTSSGSVRLTRRARLIVLLLVTAAVVILGPWRAIASSPEGVAPQGWSTVVVQPGDTLWTLAEDMDPTGDPRVIVAEIKQANSLASSALSPGQVLVVPAS